MGAILTGWRGISGRVVMPSQGGGGAVSEGFPEEFSRTDETGGGGPVGQDPVGNEIALGVEGQHPETLLGPA